MAAALVVKTGALVLFAMRRPSTYLLLLTPLFRLGSGAPGFTDLGALPLSTDSAPRHSPSGSDGGVGRPDRTPRHSPSGSDGGVGRPDTAHSFWTLRGLIHAPFSRGPLPAPGETASSGRDPDTVRGHNMISWFLPNAQVTSKLGCLSSMLALSMVMPILCMMMQDMDTEPDHHPGQGSTRDPPKWSPEMEYHTRNPYTFESWTRDLMMWS